MQQLKIGSTLQGGKYKIESVLGQGGFGITYLANQEMLDRKVCIKEFFFKEYCERDETTSQVSLGTQNNKEMVERFMAKFIKEARVISQLNHPNIVGIHDIFTENNTAYYVMDFIQGKSLQDVVKEEGAISEMRALNYTRQVADALEYMHNKNLLHLDVKPGNIMIDSNGHATLIDFGLSKQYDTGGDQTSTTPVGISHGYAPIEQYKQNGVQSFSPQTDIYSLGATLYKLLSGQTPPQPSDILDDGLPELPSTISNITRNAVKQAMQIRKADRPQNIKQFLDCFTVKNNHVVEEEHIKDEAPEHNKTYALHKPVEAKDEETVIIGKENNDVLEKPFMPDVLNEKPKPQGTLKDNEKSASEVSGCMYFVIIILGWILALICFLYLGIQ